MDQTGTRGPFLSLPDEVVDVMRIRVECYSGYRGDESPRRIILGEKRVTVKEIIDRWAGPDYRYFKIEGDDGALYIVKHDEENDAWELVMFDTTFDRAEREC